MSSSDTALGVNTPKSVNDISRESLFSQIETAIRSMGRSEDTYIVQEGIKILNRNGKACHIRAVSVRGANGKFIKPLFAGKFGGNRHQGGVTDNYEYITSYIEENLGIPKFVSEKKLAQVSIQLHQIVEESSGGIISDLGHDLAFDIYGNVIAIETNVRAGQPFFQVKNSQLQIDPNDFQEKSFIVHAIDTQFKRDKAIAHLAKYIAEHPDAANKR